MKALVYEGAERLAYREVADPCPGEGEAVVRVHSVGICGSDMHAYLGHDERRPAPLILGHEAAGIVTEGRLSGKRVTVNPLVACRECERCLEGRDNLCGQRQIISMPPREGAFAQFLKIPERNLVEIPEGFPLEKAALAEPVACGWHAVRLAIQYLKSDPLSARALVLGGGAIGVGAALCLACQGVQDVTLAESNPVRRRFLSRNCALKVSGTGDPADGAAYDIVVDGVGIEATRRAASALARPGGVIMHIGLGSATGGLDVRRMTLQEIALVGTYTYTAEDFRATAAALLDGRLGDLNWVETRELSEGARAFEDIRKSAVAAPKILLKPA